MIIINLKELYAADSQQYFAEKVNWNFHQLLRLGVGEQGEQGIQGIQGPIGPIGPRGYIGPRGTVWYSGDYSDPALDPQFIGSPSELVDGDFYFSYASGFVGMWTYSVGTPTGWAEVANISEIINDGLNLQSPMMRITTQPVPALWRGAIMPLAITGADVITRYLNQIFLSSIDQEKFYTCTNAVIAENGRMLNKSQITLARPNIAYGSNTPSVPYSIMLGEVSYNYGISVDLANPMVLANNMLKIGVSYDYVGDPTVIAPGYAHAEFDFSSIVQTQRADDVTTSMTFNTRYQKTSGLNSISGTTYMHLGSSKSMNHYQYIGSDGITAYSSHDFNGIIAANYFNSETYSIGIGTSMNQNSDTPYAYLFGGHSVDGIITNKNFIPLRSEGSQTLGAPGQISGSNAGWKEVYVTDKIAYFNGNLSFYHGANLPAYASTNTNMTMVMSQYGKVGIGRNMPNSTYRGLGNLVGYTSNMDAGNECNRAVLHVYEMVAFDRGNYTGGLSESGMMSTKYWSVLDDSGKKSAAWFHAVSSARSNSSGAIGSTHSPDISGQNVWVGQESLAQTKGAVTNMYASQQYLYSLADSAPVTNMYGTYTSFRISATAPMSIINLYGSYVNIPSDTSVTNKYGYVQDGCTFAINKYAGHMVFGGSGTLYSYPNSGSMSGTVVNGHVIGVDINNTQGSGKDMYMLPGYGAAGYAAGSLYLKGGFGHGVSGGDSMLVGGDTDTVDASTIHGRNTDTVDASTIHGGDAYVTGGPLVIKSVASSSRAGNVYISGGFAHGTSMTYVGTGGFVYINPGYYTFAHNPAVYANVYMNVNANTGLAIGKLGVGTLTPVSLADINGDLHVAGPVTFDDLFTANADAEMHGGFRVDGALTSLLSTQVILGVANLTTSIDSYCQNFNITGVLNYTSHNQNGPATALNTYNGHISFNGNGAAYGYNLYDGTGNTTIPSGHVIGVLPANLSGLGKDMWILPGTGNNPGTGDNRQTAIDSAPGNLYLYGGCGQYKNGSSVYLRAGNVTANAVDTTAFVGGNVNIGGGDIYAVHASSVTGGNVVISGGNVYQPGIAASMTPGNVYLMPGQVPSQDDVPVPVYGKVYSNYDVATQSAAGNLCIGTTNTDAFVNIGGSFKVVGAMTIAGNAHVTGTLTVDGNSVLTINSNLHLNADILTSTSSDGWIDATTWFDVWYMNTGTFTYVQSSNPYPFNMTNSSIKFKRIGKTVWIDYYVQLAGSNPFQFTNTYTPDFAFAMKTNLGANYLQHGNIKSGQDYHATVTMGNNAGSDLAGTGLSMQLALLTCNYSNSFNATYRNIMWIKMNGAYGTFRQGGYPQPNFESFIIAGNLVLQGSIAYEVE